jgi:hypothetical protein
MRFNKSSKKGTGSAKRFIIGNGLLQKCLSNAGNIYYFNSSMVRLKVKVSVVGTCILVFQFINGAIKRVSYKRGFALV